MEAKSVIRIKTIRLKPVYLFLLALVCIGVLSAMLIPQRIRLRAAEDELAQKQQELAEIKYEYEQERRNLDYMRTEEYKVQQGLAKYGWHYKVDTLIEDRALSDSMK